MNLLYGDQARCKSFHPKKSSSNSWMYDGDIKKDRKEVEILNFLLHLI